MNVFEKQIYLIGRVDTLLNQSKKLGRDLDKLGKKTHKVLERIEKE